MVSAKKIKVFLVSLVTPSETALGGFLIVKRYLLDNPHVVSHIFYPSRFSLKARIYGRLQRTPLRWLISVLECLSPPYPNDELIARDIEAFQPDVVLTVAHGWWCLFAAHVAGKWNLPLVTLFQDWWPDFDDVPKLLRPRVERQFRRIGAVSDAALCVSDGMFEELGSPPNAEVLHDVPSKVSLSPEAPRRDKPFAAVYFGNLQEYGPMMEGALRAVANDASVRLEIFGPRPRWTPAAEEEFRSLGLYHGLVPPARIHQEMRRFDAGLVAMSFDAGMRRRMRTSFPSKLAEMAQFGKPLVIWGPNYCSAIRWANGGERALCVTDPDPSAFAATLHNLAGSKSEQERLAYQTRQAAETEFNPERIYNRFAGVLREATLRRPQSTYS